MISLKPINQTNLYGLSKYLLELVRLHSLNKLPNKILLSGQKGVGKCTLAYHFINYALSLNEKLNYDIDNYTINSENHNFKTIINGTNPNFFLVDIIINKKSIDLDQIRNLILNLNKSSFNQKPRFVLIDNLEFLNLYSANALLKILEEPSNNVFFILICNDKKILKTLNSRCINFNISLTSKENLDIANLLLNGKLKQTISNELGHFFLTPGKIYKLYLLANELNYDLINFSLKDFIKKIIDNNNYKKNFFVKSLLFELIEFYFRKIYNSTSNDIYDKYDYFINKIFETKKFNLNEEVLLDEFKEKILNG